MDSLRIRSSASEIVAGLVNAWCKLQRRFFTHVVFYTVSSCRVKGSQVRAVRQVPLSSPGSDFSREKCVTFVVLRHGWRLLHVGKVARTSGGHVARAKSCLESNRTRRTAKWPDYKNLRRFTSLQPRASSTNKGNSQAGHFRRPAWLFDSPIVRVQARNTSTRCRTPGWPAPGARRPSARRRYRARRGHRVRRRRPLPTLPG